MGVSIPRVDIPQGLYLLVDFILPIGYNHLAALGVLIARDEDLRSGNAGRVMAEFEGEFSVS